MSHPANDLYLEQSREQFFSTENGFERATILFEMRDNGFVDEVENLKQEWADERQVFLESVGVVEDEVLVEGDLEYYMDVDESGAPGEDYQVTEVKRPIPSYLDVDYWTTPENYKEELEKASS